MQTIGRTGIGVLLILTCARGGLGRGGAGLGRGLGMGWMGSLVFIFIISGFFFSFSPAHCRRRVFLLFHNESVSLCLDACVSGCGGGEWVSG